MNGRMADLLTRFEHQTLPIMARHGYLQVGFWTTIVGRSEQHLTYLLAWESLAQRQEQWDAFESDAEWLSCVTGLSSSSSVAKRRKTGRVSASDMGRSSHRIQPI